MQFKTFEQALLVVVFAFAKFKSLQFLLGRKVPADPCSNRNVAWM